MNIWRDLNKKEVEEFKKWARENHHRGDGVDEIWHPVIKEEITKMEEEWQK